MEKFAFGDGVIVKTLLNFSMEIFLGIIFMLGIAGASLLVWRQQEVSSDRFTSLFEEYEIRSSAIPRKAEWSNSIMEISINNIPQRMVSIDWLHNDEFIFLRKFRSNFTKSGTIKIPLANIVIETKADGGKNFTIK
jgi:hypothetical protein